MILKEKDLWSEKIPFIKKLKDFYSKIEYKRINLWPIMANECYTYYKSQEDRGFKEILGLIIRFIFFKEDLKVEKAKGKILVSYFMNREDHHELVKKAISAFSEKEIFFMDAYEYKRNPLKMYKPKIPNFYLLFSIWLKFKRSDLKKTLGRYYWLFLARTYQRFCQIVYFKKIIDRLEPKAYVAFCSPAFGEEAIMTLICKEKGILTFSMQHGFYREGHTFGPEALLAENSIPDYFLLWGDKTSDIQKKYVDQSRIILVGNPKYSRLNRKTKTKFDPKKATIFFGNNSFNKGNLELLEIVKVFIQNHPEISFNVTVHPMNDANLFFELLKFKNVKFIQKDFPVQNLLEESNFIILYSTSVAMEALNYKIPILEYHGNDSLRFWDGKNDSFTNVEELENLFLKLKNPREYKKLIDFYEKELEKIFYFDPKKSVPEVYYDKITNIIKRGV